MIQIYVFLFAISFVLSDHLQVDIIDVSGRNSKFLFLFGWLIPSITVKARKQ